MKILSECKRFLSYGGLGTEPSINIAGKCIPRALPRAVISLAVFAFVISSAINCINSSDMGLTETLVPINYVVVFSVKLTSYGILIWKSNQIAELIDTLQLVIDKRMFAISICRYLTKFDVIFLGILSNLCRKFVELVSKFCRNFVEFVSTCIHPI